MSLHEDLHRPDRAKPSSNRAFGLVMAALFALVAGMRIGSRSEWSVVWLAVGLGFLLTGLIHPVVLAPLNRAWTAFGMLLAKMTTPIILALIFYGAFVPIALFARLRGQEFLRLRRDRSATSYWIEREAGAVRPGAMRNQF
jgi:hypothetical protein